MELFDLTKVMFEDPKAYSQVTPGEKKKHFFMINRRMAIQYPLQAHVLQHIKIDDVSVVDFWQNFLRKQYNKTPFWMFTKGVKKIQEEKEKKVNVKEDTIKEYAMRNRYDLKSVREALHFFPEEMKKELQNFEKTTS
jgi:hypothetical protein